MKTARGSITILVDNYVFGRTETIAEHGFAAFVETANGNFLFDTGRGMTITHNAALLYKDLTSISKIVLSHNHLDHTGGMPEVLRVLPREQIDVLAHPDIFAYRYRERDGDKVYGGIPFTRGHLERMGARFVFSSGYKEIEDGVGMTGEIPRITDFEGRDLQGRWLVREGQEIPDIIPDDLSLVFSTDRGLVLLLGCAHAGTINIIEHVIQQTGMDEFYAVIGGTHIGFSGEEQLHASIDALKRYKIRHLIPSHCTGVESTACMRQELGSMVHFSHVGYRLDF